MSGHRDGIALYRDTAVVLRTYKLGEADRIIVMLTENHGKVRAVAKGVRKTTSKFGARLEPLSHVHLLLYQGRELDIVSQADSVETRAPMLSSLDRSQGMAMVEAVDQLTMEREPAPHIYRMLVGVLRTVAERSGPVPCRRSTGSCWRPRGSGPSSTPACAAAGRTRRPLVAFDLPRVVCCAARAAPACRSRAGALELMRIILGGRLNEALDAPASRRPPTRSARWPSGPSSTTSNDGSRTVAMFEPH